LVIKTAQQKPCRAESGEKRASGRGRDGGQSGSGSEAEALVAATDGTDPGSELAVREEPSEGYWWQKTRTALTPPLAKGLPEAPDRLAIGGGSEARPVIAPYPDGAEGTELERTADPVPGTPSEQLDEQELARVAGEIQGLLDRAAEFDRGFGQETAAQLDWAFRQAAAVGPLAVRKLLDAYRKADWVERDIARKEQQRVDKQHAGEIRDYLSADEGHVIPRRHRRSTAKAVKQRLGEARRTGQARPERTSRVDWSAFSPLSIMKGNTMPPHDPNVLGSSKSPYSRDPTKPPAPFEGDPNAQSGVDPKTQSLHPVEADED